MRAHSLHRRETTGAVAAVAVVGSGWFPMLHEEAMELAQRVREIAAEEDAAARTFAYMFETSIAAVADTIVVDTGMAPLLRQAVDELADNPDREPSEQLLGMRRALAL